MRRINQIYYRVKPVLPGWARLALRRVRARRLREQVGDVWPIYEASARPPEGWPGWPDGRQFALVLTHDVEGERGLRRCRALAELEMEYGFRSSFNFIPRGEYQVSAELLEWLRSNGFEVGVHDLYHKGHLFESEQAFARSSEAINGHLAEWGAVGFRAGFMLHELDWLHRLKIEYDASTFDVDPFEPQPDGVQTVFPFWVRRPEPDADAWGGSGGAVAERTGEGLKERGGYIELPYTLVQDYTLFMVLQERGIGIWQKKLKWLAEKGAMALLNTHPDYLAWPGERAASDEVSVAHYRQFLEHVRGAYAGSNWHALPKEVARYCRAFEPAKTRRPRKVGMLCYSFYTGDNRVRRYAETLARLGDEVRVFCLGTEEEMRSRGWATLRGVKYYCMQSRTTLERGWWEHVWRLLRFFFRSLAALGPGQFPEGCDLLHVHNMPDFLVFACARLKFRGAKVILDIHDLAPELYSEKFGKGQTSLMIRFLRRLEGWSCRFADHVIVANHIWKETVVGRSAAREKVTALVNNVDLELFGLKQRVAQKGGPILIYAGTMNYHQGLDVLIRALGLVVGELPGIELHLYGRGSSQPELEGLAAELGLSQRVRFFAGVLLHEVSGLLSGADIGVVPKRAEGFGDQAYSTKIMEMMSQKLPVIVSRTRIDRFYFNESVVAFFESGNPVDLADKIRRVALDAGYRRALAENGYGYAQGHSWEKVKHIYVDIVDRLTRTSLNYPVGGREEAVAGLGKRLPKVAVPVEVGKS